MTTNFEAFSVLLNQYLQKFLLKGSFIKNKLLFQAISNVWEMKWVYFVKASKLRFRTRICSTVIKRRLVLDSLFSERNPLVFIIFVTSGLKGILNEISLDLCRVSEEVIMIREFHKFIWFQWELYLMEFYICFFVCHVWNYYFLDQLDF